MLQSRKNLKREFNYVQLKFYTVVEKIPVNIKFKAPERGLFEF